LLGFGQGSIQFASLPNEISFGHREVASARRAVSIIYNAIERIRNTRKESGIAATKKIRVRIDSDDPVLKSESPILARLAPAEDVIVAKSTGYSGYSGYSAAGLITIETADVDKVAECERLDKQIVEAEAQLAATQRKLNNKSFIDRAPTKVVEEHRQREKDFAAQLAKLKQARESLK
jgi:valyl-tRNA synthetase